MDEIEVKIVELPSLRAATTIGFGEGPEGIAWDRMFAWARSKGILQDGKPHRLFGMDTSSPSPASPNYGYQVWLTVGDGIEGEGNITITSLQGGLYAAAHVEVINPWEDIPGTWKKLLAWVEKSPYQVDQRPCYEESFWKDAPDYEHFALDLLLSIKKGTTP